MKQEGTSTEVKRRPGRPIKPDALTPADRAKRYREKQKATQGPDKVSEVESVKVAELTGKLVKLQMKYDLEHMEVMNLQTELANLRQSIAPSDKKIGPNPLAKQLAKLREQIAEQDKIISGCNAEINRLRDEKSSRKI